MKKYIFLMLTAVLLLTGCGLIKTEDSLRTAAHKKVAGGSAFIVANYDSDLHEHDYLYNDPPKKIIALWQNSVETLIALGAGDKIIACGGISNENYLKPEHLEEYRKIPLKSRQIFSQENILMMKPDFILGWYFDFSGKGRSIGSTDFWEKRHVNIYMNMLNGAEYKPVHTLEDEEKYIRDVGKITGQEFRAQQILADMQAKITETRERMQLQRKMKVLIISSIDKNIGIYTPRTLPGNIVTLLGGEVLGREDEHVGEDEFISYEKILMLDPDVVFLSSAPERDKRVLQTFMSIPALKNLRCIRQRHCYCIPFYTIRSPGVRVTDAVNIFADGLQKAGTQL